jgi:hypothetical protein
LYTLHYSLFHDAHHIFIYLLGDIAFLPIDVLLVMVVLHRLLVYREKQAVFKKLNMVIGAFFIEVGTELIKRCAAFDPDAARLAPLLVVDKQWHKKEFARVRREVLMRELHLDSRRKDLRPLRDFLLQKRPFLLGLLENPNLMEHEAFTDLLWSVFHLTDELAHRTQVDGLPQPDYEHLSGDMIRAYRQLLGQWLYYMQHLKQDYPYLFSLAMRTNPFDAGASVEVR